jgi:hypothetical protein
VIGLHGHVMLRHNFSAVDDEAAKAHAKRYVDGHDVEVWQLDHDHPARPMHMTDSPAFKFVDNLRPPCSKCGRPLVLTKIEPEDWASISAPTTAPRAKTPSSLSLRFEAVVCRTNHHFSDRFRAHHRWMAERVQIPASARIATLKCNPWANCPLLGLNL